MVILETEHHVVVTNVKNNKNPQKILTLFYFFTHNKYEKKNRKGDRYVCDTPRSRKDWQNELDRKCDTD